MSEVSEFAVETAALGTVLGAVEPLNEEQREWVLNTAMSRLKISSAPALAAKDEGSADTSGVLGAAENPEQPTAKEFLKNKAPKNDVQRVAVLGYYLTRYRGMESFKASDLAVLNAEARCTQLADASKALDNAARKNGYFAVAGSGRKHLTAFAEEVVDALPDQEKVQSTERGRKPRKRSSRRKSSSSDQ